jgi:hypothetical protein
VQLCRMSVSQRRATKQQDVEAGSTSSGFDLAYCRPVPVLEGTKCNCCVELAVKGPSTMLLGSSRDKGIEGLEEYVYVIIKSMGVGSIYSGLPRSVAGWCGFPCATVFRPIKINIRGGSLCCDRRER